MIAYFLTQNGVNVIIDATGHRKKWRNLARRLISRYFEVFLDCPLEICVERESKREDHPAIRRLYQKVRRRMLGEQVKDLGVVPGIDERYEKA